ncbi:MAG TPA: hypothetical protein VN851_08980 [Thermoanaerobaculia bacterium]|nr:hypothetical protein [Thermoanaerobaculia bacterium]
MKTKLATGAAILAGLFLTANAHAFKTYTCGGVSITWGAPFSMVQNTFSIAHGGQREVSLDNAISQWRGVIGMNDMVSKSGATTSGSKIVNNDGQNDAAIVNRSNIAGNNGLTAMFSSLCFFPGTAGWLEADVMVASDMTFGAVAEDTLPEVGRVTFIHEFGHAHGLDHSQGYNVMRTMQPRPLVAGPGETVDVLPDDAKGGRFLYPSGNTEINLFASAQQRIASTDTIALNNSGTVIACTGGGGKITINATVGNNGTVNVTQTERWWLNKDSFAGHSGGILIGQWNNGTFLASSAFTRPVTLTLPALAAGTYFLFHGVDVLNQVVESREDDNNVREALRIKVVPC